MLGDSFEKQFDLLSASIHFGDCSKKISKVYYKNNAAPRRKRARCQGGLESNLYLGGNIVSPQIPLPRDFLAASGQGIKNYNKDKISTIKYTKRKEFKFHGCF